MNEARRGKWGTDDIRAEESRGSGRHAEGDSVHGLNFTFETDYYLCMKAFKQVGTIYCTRISTSTLIFIINISAYQTTPYHLLSNFFKNRPTPFSTLSTLSLTLYFPLNESFRSWPGCPGTYGCLDFSDNCAALSTSVGVYN